MKKGSPEEKAPPLSPTPPARNTESYENYSDFSYSGEEPAPGSRSKYGLWVVALVSVGFLLFALSFLFTKAKVVVVPKSFDENLSLNLSATKDSADPTALSYDLVVLEGIEEKSVAAGTEEDVRVPATGRVVIYNAFSTAPQLLAIETRLEGSNGKIYKTDTKLTVPGMKGSSPGSIEVGVYAAEAGPDYNSEPLDFKIFGFKGTPKYTKFYARGKGEISGGFIGKRTVVAPADRDRAVAELRIGLQSKLYKKAADQLPAGFILFKGATVLDVPESGISAEPDASGGTTLSIRGTLSGVLFDEKKLAKKIAENTVPKYNQEDVFIPNFGLLDFSLTGLVGALAEANNVVFNLTGPAKIVYGLDQKKIAEDLAGKAKKEYNAILSTYPVVSAELVLRPFWKTSFPEKPEDIEIKVNYPQ